MTSYTLPLIAIQQSEAVLCAATSESVIPAGAVVVVEGTVDVPPPEFGIVVVDADGKVVVVLWAVLVVLGTVVVGMVELAGFEAKLTLLPGSGDGADVCVICWFRSPM